MKLKEFIWRDSYRSGELFCAGLKIGGYGVSMNGRDGHSSFYYFESALSNRKIEFNNFETLPDPKEIIKSKVWLEETVRAEIESLFEEGVQ